MSAPEITPARLRLFVDLFVKRSRDFSLHALNAEEAGNEYESQLLQAASNHWERDADALRDAADRDERLTATLAAREALLKRAGEFAHKVMGIAAGELLRDASVLAAEIAAALEEKNDAS